MTYIFIFACVVFLAIKIHNFGYRLLFTGKSNTGNDLDDDDDDDVKYIIERRPHMENDYDRTRNIVFYEND